MHRPRNDQTGFAAIALVAFLIPIVLLVGSAIQSMSGRNTRLQDEVRRERALLAAESGVDLALFEGRRGNLVAGSTLSRSGPLGDNTTYEIECTHLGSDSVNNDAWTGDTETDEADEDVFQVVAVGTSGTTRRRIVAYLGFASFLTAPETALTVLQRPSDIIIQGTPGTPAVDGRNYDINGTLAGSGHQPGLVVAPPTTVGDITGFLSNSGQNQETSEIVGSTASPSVGTGSVYSLTIFDEMMAQAHSSAHIVVTSQNQASRSWGNPTTGPQYIVYREGNLKLTGNSVGAGLLAVNGNLELTGTMTWYGVILVAGDFEAGMGTANVYGGVVLRGGPSGPRIRMGGNFNLRYSQTAIQLAEQLAGRYVAFNGWQEVSAHDDP